MAHTSTRVTEFYSSRKRSVVQQCSKRQKVQRSENVPEASEKEVDVSRARPLALFFGGPSGLEEEGDPAASVILVEDTPPEKQSTTRKTQFVDRKTPGTSAPCTPTKRGSDKSITSETLRKRKKMASTTTEATLFDCMKEGTPKKGFTFKLDESSGEEEQKCTRVPARMKTSEDRTTKDDLERERGDPKMAAVIFADTPPKTKPTQGTQSRRKTTQKSTKRKTRQTARKNAFEFVDRKTPGTSAPCTPTKREADKSTTSETLRKRKTMASSSTTTEATLFDCMKEGTPKKGFTFKLDESSGVEKCTRVPARRKLAMKISKDRTTDKDWVVDEHGSQKGQPKLTCKGYTYTVRPSRYNNVVRAWRCRAPACTAKVREDRRGGGFQLTALHNHRPVSSNVARQNVVFRLEKECKECQGLKGTIAQQAAAQEGIKAELQLSNSQIETTNTAQQRLQAELKKLETANDKLQNKILRLETELAIQAKKMAETQDREQSGKDREIQTLQRQLREKTLEINKLKSQPPQVRSLEAQVDLANRQLRQQKQEASFVTPAARSLNTSADSIKDTAAAPRFFVSECYPTETQNKCSANTPVAMPSPAVPNMMAVLKDMSKVKPRSVERSPGGTPIRQKPKESNVQDLAARIAQALRRKFAHRKQIVSPDQLDKENDWPFPETSGSPKFGCALLKPVQRRSSHSTYRSRLHSAPSAVQPRTRPERSASDASATVWSSRRTESGSTVRWVHLV
ncbi:uncharacterized protein LOC144927521 isoform X1 [Branchiostoma floridae x Branchiostoma belcheri]